MIYYEVSVKRGGKIVQEGLLFKCLHCSSCCWFFISFSFDLCPTSFIVELKVQFKSPHYLWQLRGWEFEKTKLRYCKIAFSKLLVTWSFFYCEHGPNTFEITYLAWDKKKIFLLILWVNHWCDMGKVMVLKILHILWQILTLSSTFAFQFAL